ncbi:MAG: response regulator transcription factor [Chloroflexota bacterium]
MIDITRSNANIHRILVVDDDPALLRLVKDKFSRSGYDVFTAHSGEEALTVIERQGLPHLAIVDINMPKMDGFELSQRILQFADLPIVLLTAVDEEETIIRGIESFAEDYITKPFSPRELVARVERILRRIGDFSYTLDALTEIDDYLVLDFVHQRALVNKDVVTLTPIETKLLYLLIKNAGQTVTTDFLLKRLWPMEEMFESSLRVHIHRLRNKIEPHPNEPKYILTRRGVGYTFPV